MHRYIIQLFLFFFRWEGELKHIFHVLHVTILCYSMRKACSEKSLYVGETSPVDFQNLRFSKFAIFQI